MSIFHSGEILDPSDDMIFRVVHRPADVHDLPHARAVSAAVHDGNDTKAATATILLMQVKSKWLIFMGTYYVFSLRSYTSLQYRRKCSQVDSTDLKCKVDT
jgi:hypothetical protein